ncbi:Histone acetyltransferase HPA2 [Acidisarcina polymorpha]|uniref:Histone acetyltransferase HPA2 n=2 Tax=Acidisarcina polymorpha TaxID=2211140 RepID=A0A2Z5G632_9BACT|nr:Histone acetyltransferase HPA2 [Acidisarcina polymorpha]
MTGVNYFLRQRDEFLVSTDPALLDRSAVYAFLAEARWWTELTPESLARALEHSLCFSLVEGGRQIGFARVITDRVTFAYLCDVFITEPWRGRGLGSWLIRSVLEHPDLICLKRISLITHDAQQFYLGLNFRFSPDCASYMERLR